MNAQIRPSSLTQNLLLSFVSLIIFGTILFHLTTWFAMATSKRLPFVKYFPQLQEYLADKSFLFFAYAARSSKGAKFSAVWDFDQATQLAKSLFIEEKMYGETKYRYQPNTAIYNLMVWSGTRSIGFFVPATSEIRELLKKCKVLRQIRFQTDAHGFKPTQFAPSPDSPTIFFLGDSFTEGYWVSPENTFVNLVGLKLNENDSRFTPVNLGVGGYSAIEMSWMLEHFAPEFHPKLVVVNLFPNDVGTNYVAAVKGQHIPEENYKKMFHYLNRIYTYCKRHDIQLIISTIPVREQFSWLSQFGYFQGRIRAWCEEKNVACLDPREYFRQSGARRIYFSWDPHFSEAGHARYAEFLSDYILKSKL